MHMNVKRKYQQPKCSIVNCELNNVLLTGSLYRNNPKATGTVIDSSWESIMQN